ncbi:MAG: hypothetical protein L6Q47_14170 [Ignavibacteriaceae bacterium]|nr:hypothetical protein [Ignavibacteriaceae bacterium]
MSIPPPTILHFKRKLVVHFVFGSAFLWTMKPYFCFAGKVLVHDVSNAFKVFYNQVTIVMIGKSSAYR